MYAVFDNHGKQYKVIQGQIIKIEKIPGNIGDKIEFKNILIIYDKNQINIGNPIIPGAKIIAQLILHGKNKKIKIIKFRRRKHFRKTQGHRQLFTNIKILKIQYLI
ncbi:50S ribosomal protein L21 [Enterobacteriaceae endosymbiont of Donacia bicoloricornis]|uniref:50S ribosomal protein L21 n=1 Tax=Enterobacteriaceae endosymbiont of Donacia bicoloricornis TaxID=2675772 RepID=UPI00144961FB|nr:50S ribosomal protein L21 [Enterobacteriaceae endosymbiont of Donacia bicoloricornis]QJC37936.1 50S ribosomal protein L21 [Enterobacteriaceae endosymbiont of Donacia bicoloricornis]